MKTTLENLPLVIRENRLKELAINIVKYQNFKTSAFINKIDSAGYTKTSLVSLISYCIIYIQTGRKNNKVTSSVYKYIDDAIKQCIQPLTPSERDQRWNRKKSNKKKEVVTPVQKVLQNINDKAIEDKKYQIAVQVDDNIKLQDDLKHAEGFLDGLRFCGKVNVKIVRVKIEEVNEQSQ